MSTSSPPVSPPVNDWTAATSGVRDAAKWIVLSLGAVGVAIFGAAPALKGLNFSWSDEDDRVQLLWAIGFAVLGLVGIIGLIMVVGRTMMPVVVTIARLSRETESEVNAKESYLLPPGSTDLDQFRQKLRAAPDAVAFAREQLASTPVHKKEEAQAVVDATIAVQESLLQWRDSILRRDAFNRVRSSFLRPGGRAWVLWVLIASAAIGSVGFMFSISSPTEEDPPEASASVGQVAYLSAGSDESAWTTLTGSAEIAGCVDEQGRYLVLIVSVVDDRTTVRTLPRDEAAGCVGRQFEVLSPEVGEIELLAEPKKITVNYSPSPQPPR